VARYADRVNVTVRRQIDRAAAPRAEIYANPRRIPNTLRLLRSVPALDERGGARLDPIEGQPPDLSRLARAARSRRAARSASSAVSSTPRRCGRVGAPWYGLRGLEPSG